MGKGLQHSSGRVIALGRLLLASLFLTAVLLDRSQPAHAPTVTYALIGAYIFFAAAVGLLTWRNWWLDAKLAGPAHAVDIMMFTLLVLLTEGYTSPFYAFFMFVLLSASIRWDWHATALSAMLLTMLYLAAGLVVLLSGVPFETYGFLVRTGHLVIISLLLIWFGSSRPWRRANLEEEQLLARPPLDESPLEAGLRAAMASVRAKAGMFFWAEEGRQGCLGLAVSGKGVGEVEVPANAMQIVGSLNPFIFDLRKGRGLCRDAQRNLVALDPSAVLLPSLGSLPFREGLAVPVQSDRGVGLMLLGEIRPMSTDHIEIGQQIASSVTAHLQRYALVRAAAESAEARSRLTLARDLHDSVVQFIAGAAFRLEAMKRANDSGRDVAGDLNDLKQLMLQEQRELRSFIAALRSGPLASFGELAEDLRSLGARLSRQWDISCEVAARPAELMIPTRLRLDAQQLMREAVANAVRHAAAQSVSVGLEAAGDELRLDVVNDGRTFPRRSGRIELPQSLRERVEQAGGTIDLSRGMGVTKLSIALPIGEDGR